MEKNYREFAKISVYKVLEKIFIYVKILEPFICEFKALINKALEIVAERAFFEKKLYKAFECDIMLF